MHIIINIFEKIKKCDERMEKGLLSLSARLLFVFLVAAVIVSVNLSPAFASDATINTDKTKYSLGETMTITGAGFIANSPVTITVLRPDKMTDTLPVVTVDSSGNFTTSYIPPAIPGRYKITATDETNTAVTASTEADASTSWLQCAENDAANGKPLGVGYCNWIGSELNSKNALLYEGAATNQEDVFTGLASGTHSLVFGIQATKGGKHTYDWLVSDAQATAADAADGITLQLNHCTAGDTTTCNNLVAGGHFVDIPYPPDPFTSKDGTTQDKINAYNALFPSGQTIRLYSDAAITNPSLSLVHMDGKQSGSPLANGGDTDDSYIWYTLNWTSTGSSAMLWADADIALGGDGTGRSWGAGLGASSVSGSPYHFYQISLDGVGGSLDNQMAASAVSIPPTTPKVTTQVQNASNVDITDQSVLIGTVVHDNATVDTGSASVTIPAGSTFTFHLYANGTCTAPSMTDQTGVAVASGAQTGSANSNTFTPGVGSYSYMVNFTSGNTASVTNATGVCEPLTVTGVPNTTVNISSSAATIQTGSSVTLTVTENNTGTVPLTSPNVTLTGGLSTTLVKGSGSFVSGDTNNNGILDVGEIWTWSLNSGTLTSSATFTATGHGFDPLNNDITYPYYVNEQNAVSVTVVDAQINITGDSTNEVGQAHTFTVTVKKDLDDGAGLVAANGVTVTSGITGTGSITGGTCTTTTTNGSGQCTIIVNSTNAGTGTVNASTTFVIGSMTVTRATGDGLSGDSPNTHKTWVDANIVLSPLRATNNISSPHTITATVKQDFGDGAGFVNAPNGTLVTFSLINSGGATAYFVGGVNTCTTTSGTCSVQINSSTPGSVDIHATTTFSVGGVSLTRETGDGLSGDSANANKIYVAGSLKITKVVDLGSVVNPTAISQDFTINVTGPSYPSGHDIVFHLVNGVLQAPTNVTLSPLIPGQYNVVEAGAGANWSEVVATSPVDVVANDIAEVTVTNTYVPGSLKVTKELNLGTYPFNVTMSFSVNVTGPSYPSGTVLILDMVNGILTNSPQTLNNLIPGSYNVTEADPGIAWVATGGGSVTVNPDATNTSSVTNTLKQPHTTISITPNVFETLPGENVILTITDKNDGDVPLTSPYVNLTYDSTTITLNKTSYYVSGDTNNNDIMDPGETWTWSYTVLISNTTTFSVAGHGLDLLGNDISPANGYTTEAATVTVRTIGATRTLGFWQTHTNFTSFVFSTYFGGGMPIGTAPHKGLITNTLLPGQSQLFGGFYAPIAKTTTGTKRSQIDQARIQLLQQLIAAKLNCAAFGCSATIQGQIANADSVYATGTKDQILAAASQMDAYNNGGDDIAIPPSLPPTGKATPDKSQSYANISFWNSP